MINRKTVYETQVGFACMSKREKKYLFMWTVFVNIKDSEIIIKCNKILNVRISIARGNFYFIQFKSKNQNNKKLIQ